MALYKDQIIIVIRRNITPALIKSTVLTLASSYLLFALYKNSIIAPLFINGHPITFGDLISAYKDHPPGNVVDQVILEKMVAYEAEKKHIVVTKDEVAEEILKMQQEAYDNGKTLYELMRDNKETAQNLERNVRTHITIVKILEQDSNITEKDIDDFINSHKELYPDGQSKAVREEVKQILIQKYVSQEYGAWAKDAKANSQIDYGVNLHKEDN